MNKNTTERLSIWGNWSFLLAIFLDGITLSLMFPLLNDLLANKDTSLLPEHYSQYDRELTYSIVLTIYMFCWAWGNALISSLSDILGRKPTLLISMTGKIVGFGMLLVSVLMGSVVLLVVSRIVDGLTNGVQPEAEAVGVDLSPRRGLRPAYIGYLLLPVALGDTVGSFLLAFIKDLTWLGTDIRLRPIVFGLGIGVVALALIAVQFKETFQPTQRRKIDLFYPLKIFREALHYRQICFLGGIFLVSVIGWSLFFNYLESFATKRYGLSKHALDLLLVMPGLGFVLAWLVLVRVANHLLSSAKVFILLKGVAAVFIVLTVLLPQRELLYGLVFVAALFNSTAYVTILGLFANSSDAHKQGWVMGIAGALHFAAFGLASLLATPLLKFSYTTLFVTAACLMMFSAFLMLLFQRHLQGPATEDPPGDSAAPPESPVGR